MTQLKRFIEAQERAYPTALAEIKAGEKRSHGMWYIFPQLKGLGFSETADYYGITDLQESKAYYNDAILGKRLLEITNAVLDLKSADASQIFGYPDDLKFRSCMTLFSIAVPKAAEFKKCIDKFFAGQADDKTIALLKSK
jgi:uncharacterized protein (DUF1810 family)